MAVRYVFASWCNASVFQWCSGAVIIVTGQHTLWWFTKQVLHNDSTYTCMYVEHLPVRMRMSYCFITIKALQLTCDRCFLRIHCVCAWCIKPLFDTCVQRSTMSFYFNCSSFVGIASLMRLLTLVLPLRMRMEYYRPSKHSRSIHVVSPEKYHLQTFSYNDMMSPKIFAIERFHVKPQWIPRTDCKARCAVRQPIFNAVMMTTSKKVGPSLINDDHFGTSWSIVKRGRMACLQSLYPVSLHDRMTIATAHGDFTITSYSKNKMPRQKALHVLTCLPCLSCLPWQSKASLQQFLRTTEQYAKSIWESQVAFFPYRLSLSPKVVNDIYKNAELKGLPSSVYFPVCCCRFAMLTHVRTRTTVPYHHAFSL